MKNGAGGLRIARPFLLLLALAVPGAGAGPADRAQARAEELRIWNDPQWLRLGHWKKSGLLRRWRSDAQSGFFLSADGNVNPESEARAMVSGLFAVDPGAGKHPRCLFPARSAWLIERLSVSPADLPVADCSKYQNWRALMDANSVSLIFASAFMSNPSSMFGHTFLRLERGAMGEDQRLRDNTLNFAANTGPDSGALFAVKGLLGLYPGQYTVMPYYMKVAEYNDVDNRDLWEYRLALSSAEVDRLAAHIWEMGPAIFPYYFFSKNCSYQLMPALEAAAPRLSLMPGSPPIVGPVDTLLAVQGVPGLVSRVDYRPSHATTMLSRRALLTRDERRAAWAYAHGRLEEGDGGSVNLPDARRALVLDSAEDYILYKAGFSPDVSPDVRALERPIFVRRAKLAAPAFEPAPPSWAAPPEQGHLRHRLILGGGARRGGSFLELAWRPGYHDAFDRPKGFTPGAAIEGFGWRARYDLKDRRAYVRDVRLVEILSVTPFDSWTRKPSWSAGTGLDTAFELGKRADRSLVYEGHGGSGIAGRPWDAALAYALAQAEGQVGSPLASGYRVGGALRMGVMAEVTSSVHVVLDGALTATAWGDRTPNHRLRATINWAATKDEAIRFEGLLRGGHREAGVYAVIYR